ncbi:unnamed protein product [Cylindrotheca closterium]|uniref:DUF6824 domain-containing protein n=1 Tax=Cylindrotheca closterium TaxID=2856 RepID=A0AAD2JJN1_9STRA|nr:unnamed protein product [Cylindrotheca closterium]CAJ1955757.1 unnamed protein product [Cylindrotheca closterium]CAJ1955759.1 unnamed protein product [Cylindrotheca closterium]
MASSNQYNESSSCRPCKSGRHQPGTGQTVPIMRNRQSGNHDVHNAMKPTEEMIASELYKLSVQERVKAFDDVHCVGEELRESSEMIQKSLAVFKETINKERNIFYDIAMTQNRAYVEDPSFRLKFLRANRHNVGKSVRQMMSFLKEKATYFGNDKIARDITLDDLNEADKSLLLSGFYHIQEERDRAGRAIIHWFGSMLGRVRPENLIRAAYFVWINILLQELTVQTKGVVTVYHNASRTGVDFVMPGVNFIMTVSNATASFPVRFSSMHYCLQTTEGNLVLNNSFLGAVVKTLPVYSKVRSRIHVGSIVELQYALRSHGIPMDTFPVDIDGNIRDDIFYVWFHKHQLEQNIASTVSEAKSLRTKEDEALAPTKTDVLLGRGRVTQSWPGNIKCREFLEKHRSEYDKLPRNERKKKAMELTQELGAKGVRFFEQTEPGEWVEIDFFEATKKVIQLIRTLRKKK